MVKSSKILVEDALRIFKENSKHNGITGVPTGFKELDMLTCGWQPGELIIIGGRPGMGKLAFAISMIKNVAVDFKQPTAFFSLEMKAHNYIRRMIASETGISIHALKTGRLDTFDWKNLNIELDNLSNAPIYIDDTPYLSMSDLKIKATKLVINNNVKLIVIDCLQLMTNNSLTIRSREEEIASISRNLKILAVELNISIVALSHLSRCVELRGGNKRPMLSDLRESGSIEQDADIVMFLYRPEYYNIIEWDDEEGTSCEGEAELIVAKHRNGGLNNIRLKFLGHLSKFSDLDYDPFKKEN